MTSVNRPFNSATSIQYLISKLSLLSTLPTVFWQDMISDSVRRLSPKIIRSHRQFPLNEFICKQGRDPVNTTRQIPAPRGRLSLIAPAPDRPFI
ncbi:hypothetical protein, partial [Acinetobacter baumannii]|uniref:hypothetical protein n=1 Tax=Acinetobacter baumannii TaxID=470 RepID=UPI002234AEFD